MSEEDPSMQENGEVEAGEKMAGGGGGEGGKSQNMGAAPNAAEDDVSLPSIVRSQV
jgi:hypothetical protein